MHPIHPSIHPSTYPSIYLSVCLVSPYIYVIYLWTEYTLKEKTQFPMPVEWYRGFIVPKLVDVPWKAGWSDLYCNPWPAICHPCRLAATPKLQTVTTNRGKVFIWRQRWTDVLQIAVLYLGSMRSKCSAHPAHTFYKQSYRTCRQFDNAALFMYLRLAIGMI